MAERSRSPRSVVNVFVITCIGAVLCSGLPSMKAAMPKSRVDSSSWFELLRESPGIGMDPVKIEGDVHPPKHIMKIMKKLTVNHELLRGRGNTVRSVLPRQEVQVAVYFGRPWYAMPSQGEADGHVMAQVWGETKAKHLQNKKFGTPIIMVTDSPGPNSGLKPRTSNPMERRLKEVSVLDVGGKTLKNSRGNPMLSVGTKNPNPNTSAGPNPSPKGGGQKKDTTTPTRSKVVVLALVELTCSELMYVFTVRPRGAEDFKAAELQYFASNQLTTMDSNSVLSIQVHLIEDTPPGCQLIGIHRQPSPGRRWRTLDITSHLVHVMNASKSTTSKIVIGVSFKVLAGSHDTPHDRDVIERVISNHARPFLLMYALEDESNEKNSVFPWAKEEARKLHHEKTGHSRHARSIDTKTYPIITNEFPEGGDTNVAHQATFQHFTEQDSKRRKEKKRTSKKRKGNNKKHGKAPLLDPTSSLSDDEIDPVLNDDDMNTVDPSDGVCSRHPMFVNFNTIHWDRYVIAPAGFDAYYCAGPCSFPLSKTANPSNHAAIQSVMSAVTSQDVPPPCCVPQSMSPLSILFFDEESNVALKTYQNMVVESCGCR